MRATGAYAVEKLSVELLPSPGVGLAERALLDGAVEVLWAGQCGPMKHHDENPTRPSPALQRSSAAIRSRSSANTPIPGFRLADLSQMPTAIVSEVPTPWLCLQEDLRQAGIDPAPLRREGRDDLISLPSARSRRAGRGTRALLGTLGVGTQAGASRRRFDCLRRCLVSGAFIRRLTTYAACVDNRLARQGLTA
jgi:hypothetical protein